jgi:nitroimidazol reductase NimA-like FMN-containing flavoprotein (pyridoxamine 5'-phosphate oxidase superfamily)
VADVTILTDGSATRPRRPGTSGPWPTVPGLLRLGWPHVEAGEQGGKKEEWVVGDDRWRELTADECRTRLAERHLGRLALLDGDGPVIFPVNYVFDRLAVVFRTGPGTKLDAAAGGGPVAFEVDAVDEANRTGWSVLVRGDAVAVTDPGELRRLRTLPLYPWAPGDRRHYVRIVPRMVSGRLIALPEDLPPNWWG